MRFWPEPKRERADGKRFLSWPEPLTRSRVGVVLVNLGTPEAPTAPAIRKYLREFLSDPRVIEIPKWLWWPILNGPILMARPRKLAPRYQSIWMEGGSPLLVYTQRQTAGVQRILSERGLDVQVQTGMRYGKPSIQDAMLNLRDSGCEHILVVPMYPQYASSTTATVVDEATRVAGHMRNQPALRFIKRFHTDPRFLQPLADKISALWQAQGRPQKLVMSFHGLPRQCVDIGDPYCRDSYETARALATLLGLSDDQYLVTFQSRFGPAKWLEPYTSVTLEALGREGVGRVDVVCPGFVADCLETLEEIAMEGSETFLHAGGKTYHALPCLNERSDWIEALAALVRREAALIP